MNLPIERFLMNCDPTRVYWPNSLDRLFQDVTLLIVDLIGIGVPAFDENDLSRCET